MEQPLGLRSGSGVGVVGVAGRALDRCGVPLMRFAIFAGFLILAHSGQALTPSESLAALLVCVWLGTMDHIEWLRTIKR